MNIKERASRRRPLFLLAAVGTVVLLAGCAIGTGSAPLGRPPADSSSVTQSQAQRWTTVNAIPKNLNVTLSEIEALVGGPVELGEVTGISTGSMWKGRLEGIQYSYGLLDENMSVTLGILVTAQEDMSLLAEFGKLEATFRSSVWPEGGYVILESTPSYLVYTTPLDWQSRQVGTIQLADGYLAVGECAWRDAPRSQEFASNCSRNIANLVVEANNANPAP